MRTKLFLLTLIIFSVFFNSCKYKKEESIKIQNALFPVPQENKIQNVNAHIINLSKENQDKVLEINAANYENNITLTGTHSYGILIVTDGTTPLTLTLDDVKINSVNSGCIRVTKKSQVNLFLKGSSSLTDGRKFGTNYKNTGSKDKGTLSVKGNLILNAAENAELTITQNYKNAINAGGYMLISNGNITLTTENGRDGVFAATGFYMQDGNLTITGNGKNPKCISRGIVVEGKESGENNIASKKNVPDYKTGRIVIRGGKISIKTYGKSITAKWKLEDDAKTESLEDDPDASVYIYGGTLDLESYGPALSKDVIRTPAVYTNADGLEKTDFLTVVPEAIEGKSGVYIFGGDINIRSGDDGINAGSSVVITDGSINIDSTKGDAIDSNGTILITGGTVKTLARLGSEDGLDCGDRDGFIKITGGTVTAISAMGMTSAREYEKSTGSVLILRNSNFETQSESNRPYGMMPPPPDFSPDSAPDFAPDSAPDFKPDLAPDFTSDFKPDSNEKEKRPKIHSNKIPKNIKEISLEWEKGQTLTVSSKNGKTLFSIDTPKDISVSKIIISTTEISSSALKNLIIK